MSEPLIYNRTRGDITYKSAWVCHAIDPGKLPTGDYNIKLCKSPKFKKTLPLIYNNKISPKRGFRIHAGNTLEDSDGCILVGFSKAGKDRLLESHRALIHLMAGISFAGITSLKIVEE